MTDPNDFDLNALFSRVPTREPQKKKPEKIEIEEAKNVEPGITTNLTSVQLYNQLDKKFMNDGSLISSGEGIQILRNMSSGGNKFDEKIQNKTFLLDKFVKPRAGGKQGGKFKLVSSKFKKKKKLFTIPKDKISYQLFLALNKSWKQYIEELVSKEKAPHAIFEKVLKADFHGAIIKILESKCKTYEGRSGIVVMETMRTFKIITPEDQLITVLKQNIVFLVQVLERELKMYGCHLQYRPADRMKTKFRMRFLETIC